MPVLANWGLVLLLNFSPVWSFNAGRRLRSLRELSAPSSLDENPRRSLQVQSPADPWLSSSVLEECFPDVPRLGHLASLVAPKVTSSNVFFDQVAPAVVGGAVETSGAKGAYLGVAQILPAKLRPEALQSLSPRASSEAVAAGHGGRAPPSTFFVQYVAVLPASRRKGIGSALMSWAEAEARFQGASELWLAVGESNAEALAMHESCGFEVVSNDAAFSNHLMRKVLTAPSETRGVDGKEAAGESAAAKAPETGGGGIGREVATKTAAVAVEKEASRWQEHPRPGPSAQGLARELSAQALSVAVPAALGISLVAAPLGGRSVPALLHLDSSSSSSSSLLASTTGSALEAPAELLLLLHGPAGFVLAALLGTFAGLGAESLRRLAVPDPHPPALLEECRRDAGVAAQKALTYRVAGARGVGLEAVAAVAAWQLSVALAEELLYRGLVQSSLQSLIATAAAALGHHHQQQLALSDVVALVCASALFGAAHMAWAQEPEEGPPTLGDAGAQSPALSPPPPPPPPTKSFLSPSAEWFVWTGSWGLVYGTVFAASGYHLAAPLFCHASQNVWWCLEDAAEMGRASPEELESLFERGRLEGGS